MLVCITWTKLINRNFKIFYICFKFVFLFLQAFNHFSFFTDKSINDNLKVENETVTFFTLVKSTWSGRPWLGNQAEENVWPHQADTRFTDRENS